MKTLKEIYIDGLRKGKEESSNDFHRGVELTPNRICLLWEEYSKDLAVIEPTPESEKVVTSSKNVLGPETELFLNKNRGVVNLDMNEKGEIKIV